MESATGTCLDVTTIGEGQLRLTTGVGTSLREATALQMFVAGTEANVVGLLARLGRRTGFVTALPTTPLGTRITDELAAAGIDLTRVIWRDEGRLALYFVDESPAPVPSRVYYDRQRSAFTQLEVDDVDWEYVSAGRIVHLTGITPALTTHTRALVETAIEGAQASNQLVSFDVNYRRNLWSPEAAANWMDRQLTGRVDVLTCARRDAVLLFGSTGPAERVAANLAARFGARTVLVSDGAQAVHCRHDGEEYSREPVAITVVDRVGAGDALVGGFLHGYLASDVEVGLRYGVTAAGLTLTRRGEQLRTTEAELNNLSEQIGGTDIDR